MIVFSLDTVTGLHAAELHVLDARASNWYDGTVVLVNCTSAALVPPYSPA